jgi:hypothetical protein
VKNVSDEYRGFICNTFTKYTCVMHKKIARRFVKVSSVRSAHVREKYTEWWKNLEW